MTNNIIVNLQKSFINYNLIYFGKNKDYYLNIISILINKEIKYYSSKFETFNSTLFITENKDELIQLLQNQSTFNCSILDLNHSLEDKLDIELIPDKNVLQLEELKKNKQNDLLLPILIYDNMFF